MNVWCWDDDGKWVYFDEEASKEIDDEIQYQLENCNSRIICFPMTKGPWFSQKQNSGVYFCNVTLNHSRTKIKEVVQLNIKTTFERNMKPIPHNKKMISNNKIIKNNTIHHFKHSSHQKPLAILVKKKSKHKKFKHKKSVSLLHTHTQLIEQKFADELPFNPVWKYSDEKSAWKDYTNKDDFDKEIDELNIGESFNITRAMDQWTCKKLTETTAILISHSEKLTYKLHIFESTRPRNNFKNSNFLKLYNEFGENHMELITPHAIKLSLPSVIIKRKLAVKLKQLQKQQCDDIIERICVWLWSLEADADTENLYKMINEALYSDDYDNIELYMPLIRGINKYLVQEIKIPMITYRGSKMSVSHFRYIKSLRGCIVRCPAIVASSENEDNAKQFQSNYMLEIEIPKGIWNAAPISQHSAFKNEQEVLFPPYSSFRIKGTKKNKIMLKALDNKNVAHDVPSIFM
eukprot:199553_1